MFVYFQKLGLITNRSFISQNVVEWNIIKIKQKR